MGVSVNPFKHSLVTFLFVLLKLTLPLSLSFSLNANAKSTESHSGHHSTPTHHKSVHSEKIANHKASVCPCACEKKADDHHAKADTGISAEIALNWIIHGNQRFQKGNVRKDGQNQKDRDRLVPSQKPHTIVLSCSDSRVPPEVVFDQKLGEIFVVRTAGESIDNMAIASIEYALDHLGSHLLVVLGHESCGAVKAAFSTLDGSDAGSTALNALVKDIQPRIKKFAGGPPSNAFISEAKANALGVASDLIGRSNIIAKKIESGELKIETAIYHLTSGWVEFYSESTQTNLAAKENPGVSRQPASEHATINKSANDMNGMDRTTADDNGSDKNAVLKSASDKISAEKPADGHHSGH
jgi:carbonic anhydrase